MNCSSTCGTNEKHRRQSVATCLLLLVRELRVCARVARYIVCTTGHGPVVFLGLLAILSVFKKPISYAAFPMCFLKNRRYIVDELAQLRSDEWLCFRKNLTQRLATRFVEKRSRQPFLYAVCVHSQHCRCRCRVHCAAAMLVCSNREGYSSTEDLRSGNWLFIRWSTSIVIVCC